MKSKLGPDHPNTLQHGQPGGGLLVDEALDKSVPLFEEMLTLQETKLGRDHPDTLMEPWPIWE